MAVELDENIAELLTNRFLNKLSATEWAVKALERGFDSRNLRVLASMLSIDAASEIEEKERLSLAELGWDRYLPYVYMIQWARRIAKRILSGEIDPKTGSAELYLILRAIDAHFELGAWYSIDDLLDCNEYDGVESTDEEIATYIRQASDDFLRKTDSNLDELTAITFEQAEAGYRNFLKANNISRNLRRIFREDVIADGLNISIRAAIPADNREAAERCFGLGKQRNLGIAIQTICTLNGDPCCYIELPVDDTDAMYRLIGNRYVKYSFSVSLRDARTIQNPILWWFKRLFEPKRGNPYWIDDIPSRHTLLPKISNNKSGH